LIFDWNAVAEESRTRQWKFNVDFTFLGTGLMGLIRRY